MEGFEPVTLTWKGEEHTVEPDRIMGLIVRLEDILTAGTGQQAITILARPSGPNHGRLAQAYGAALRYAGAKVSDAEIYQTLVKGMAESETELLRQMQEATIGLFAILAPPVALAMAEDTPKKKAKAGAKQEP